MSEQMCCFVCKLFIRHPLSSISLSEENNRSKVHHVHKWCFFCKRCGSGLTFSNAVIPDNTQDLLCIEDHLQLTKHVSGCGVNDTQDYVQNHGINYKQVCCQTDSTSSLKPEAHSCRPTTFDNKVNYSPYSQHSDIGITHEDICDETQYKAIPFMTGEEFFRSEFRVPSLESERKTRTNSDFQLIKPFREGANHGNQIERGNAISETLQPRNESSRQIVKMTTDYVNGSTEQQLQPQPKEPTIHEKAFAIKGKLVEVECLDQPAETTTKVSEQSLVKVSTESYDNSSPSSFKRNRISIDAERRNILIKAYKVERFPNRKTRESLGEETGLGTRQVQVWFQNMRSKDKKEGLYARKRSKKNVKPDVVWKY